MSQFQLKQLEKFAIGILSASHDKLLISTWGQTELFIHSQDNSQGYRFLSTISTTDNDTLRDALWSPHEDNIVYTAQNSNKVVVIMLNTGNAIAKTQMAYPQYLSASDDDLIYLADWITGVHRSTDGGRTWNFVFKSPDRWHCWQVIKVTTDSGDFFWTMEWNGYSDKHLRTYSVNSKRPDGHMTTQDISLFTNDKPIDLFLSRLLYMGKTVVLSDYINRTAHAFSTNGSYIKRLGLLKNRYAPYSGTINKKNKQLFVGVIYGIVGVLNLI